MINYYYDNTNEFRPFTHQLYANDNTMPPDNALRVAPEFRSGYYPCEKNGEWVLVEDHREKTAYDIETQEPVEIDYLGSVKTGYTLLAPFEFCKWEKNKWVLDVEAKNTAKIEQNTKNKNAYIADATTKIETLTDVIDDAIELEMLVSDIELQLKNWKKYRILLTLVDVSDINVTFPKQPS